MSAAHAGNADLVRLLLEQGADPRLRTPDGRSLAELAAGSRNPEVQRLVAEALR